jgi:hypothetical protein
MDKATYLLKYLSSVSVHIPVIPLCLCQAGQVHTPYVLGIHQREREKEDGDSLTLVYFLLSCYFIINFCPQSHCKCCCFCLECSFLSFSSITKLVKYVPSVSHTKVNFLGEAFLDSRGSVVILCISPHIFLYFAFITSITRFFFRVFFLQG